MGTKLYFINIIISIHIKLKKVEKITPGRFVKVDGILFNKNGIPSGAHNVRIYDANLPENIEMIKQSQKEEFIRKVVRRISSTNWNKITYEEAEKLNNFMDELNIRIW